MIARLGRESGHSVMIRYTERLNNPKTLRCEGDAMPKKDQHEKEPKGPKQIIERIEELEAIIEELKAKADKTSSRGDRIVSALGWLLDRLPQIAHVQREDMPAVEEHLADVEREW